ncbi:MAG: nucleotidyltransferase domain-containing protein [Phycisphaerae bacterium]|jgi:predicted nucleotidyltransferase
MVAMSQITELCERIAREFDPEKIILFGSYADGTPGPDSDVDLLVIMPFGGTGFDKSLEVLERVDPRFAIDLIVRCPEDTERRYREFDPLIREALDRGRILYERNR